MFVELSDIFVTLELGLICWKACESEVHYQNGNDSLPVNESCW